MWAGARSLSLDKSGDLALVGGNIGIAGVYSLSQKQMVRELFEIETVGSVTDAVWAGDWAVFATSKGFVKIFDNASEVSSHNGHAGEVTALAVHPSNEILASVGVDKSYIIYDLATFTQAIQIYTDSCEKPMSM